MDTRGRTHKLQPLTAMEIFCRELRGSRYHCVGNHCSETEQRETSTKEEFQKRSRGRRSSGTSDVEVGFKRERNVEPERRKHIERKYKVQRFSLNNAMRPTNLIIISLHNVTLLET